MTPLELKEATGCGIELCKQAVKYSNANGGGDDKAIAYLKDKSL